MTSLSRIGYFFDDEGVLRTISNNRTFKFTTQEKYEELGEAIDEEIYRLMETKCSLEREPLRLPGKTDDEEDCSFIFVSKNCKKAEKLLVLIHGSGVVRAGQWARRLIINENLECGTQIPYIQKAMELGWGVVVMNTNLNESQDEDLLYSRTPVEHAETVWKSWVAQSEAKEIYVVAHSRGGYETASVLKKHGNDERITAICLTDSPWFEFSKSCAQRQKPLFVVNFLAHPKLADQDYKIADYSQGTVANLYAGTRTHEWSSHCAIDAVFHIFESDINEQNYLEVLNEAKLKVKPEKPREGLEEPEAKKVRV